MSVTLTVLDEGKGHVPGDCQAGLEPTTGPKPQAHMAQAPKQEARVPSLPTLSSSHPTSAQLLTALGLKKGTGQSAY